MSGLCGIVSREGRPVDAGILRAMLDAGAHRGPDGARAWLGEGAALGHLALDTAPEDRLERQPLAESGLVVSADARIDNREQLAHSHAAAGEPARRTAASSRLILAAYQRWVTACPEHLLGDFAFAVWDARERSLLLARDAMGLRPLYYRLTPSQLLFASEIGQLIACPVVPVELDERMVAAHLTGQPTPLDWTFYRGIAQLPPGHALLVEGSRHRLWRYWDVDPGHRIRYRNDQDYAEHFRDLFKEAVRCRLRSVRPVGLMLSGGVDSGSVAATAGWLLENERERLSVPSFRTYSYAFDRLTQCDERHVSRLITDRYCLSATDVPAEDAHPLAGFPEHGPTRDAPSYLAHQPLHERVFARARADGVATMMTGCRGDLLVGCDHDHLGLLATGLWREVLADLRTESGNSRRFPRIVAKRLLLPALMSWWPPCTLVPMRRRLWGRMAGWHMVPPYPDWLRTDFADRVGLAELAQRVEAPPGLAASSVRQRYETIFIELHMRSLVDLERNQARFGLAIADAWSDRRLAEFVLAIPQSQLHRPSDYKSLARRAMIGLMPEEARRKVGKVTLGPLAHYALRTAARNTISDLITDSEVAARGYVLENKLQAFYEAVRLGERSVAGLWGILSLERWLREYWR